MRLPNVSHYYIIFTLVFFLSAVTLSAENIFVSDNTEAPSDSIPSQIETKAESKSKSKSTMENPLSHFSCTKIHRLGIDYRPEYVLPTNEFVRGDFEGGSKILQTHAIQLKYSFRFAENTLPNLIYHNVYQGIGASYQIFGEPSRLGNPTSLYLFQGARLFSINKKLSFNYEWDFGLSFGWKAYDNKTNPYNTAVGSPVNAYMNLNFYVNYPLSHQIDFISGVSITHFSNGNTEYPNAGINTLGLRLGLVYLLTPEKENQVLERPPIYQKFPKHWSSDCVVFGAWRRNSAKMGDQTYSSPDAYAVSGFNIAGMYNLSYIFRTGISLDGVYDQSANIYIKRINTNGVPVFTKPSFSNQAALGISARSELVMPYFRINIGIGANFLGKGDQKGTYQVLALKIDAFKSSFIHIGYNLQDFHKPNYLMLGIGYRFHDKYPRIYRK